MSTFISEEFRERLLEAVDIVEIVSRYVNLKRAGQNFKARCPFHTEKTPSFFVSPHKQIFKCFGCGVAGNVITFLMQIESLSYLQAVEILAKEVGLELPHIERPSSSQSLDDLYELNKLAMIFFQASLKKHFSEIKFFFEKRKIPIEAALNFGIGYAPPGFTELLDFMLKKGIPEEKLLKISLIRKNQRGKRYDFFRNRIIFPIQDHRGRVVGFGGRLILDEPNQPKYLNTPENILFKKRDILYGLNFTKEYIRKQGEVIIVEGYMDFFRLWISGIKNCVASMGTSLTLSQLKKLKRYTENLIFSYDSDPAGQKATIRAIEDVLPYGENFTFKVAVLPDGEDPDSCIVKKGLDTYLKTLKEAKDFLFFKLEYLKKIYPLDNPRGKFKIINQLSIPLLSITNPILQSEYIKELSSLIAVSEKDFREFLFKVKKGEGNRSLLQKEKKLSGYQKSIDNLIFFVINDKVKNWQEVFPYLPERVKNLLLKVVEWKNTGRLKSLRDVFELVEEGERSFLERISELEFVYESAGAGETDKILEDTLYNIKLYYVRNKRKKLKKELDEALQKGLREEDIRELQREYLETLKFEKKLKLK